LRPLPWLIVAFTVVLAAAGLMTLHTVRHAMRMRRATEPLRPWMSIPYIAHSHHVPHEVLYQAAGLPADRHDHRPLGRIAREQGRPVDELIARLEAAIARSRANKPPGSRGSIP
jgi:hypothetical protein